ncbi:MAG TPA: hypothetical protein VMW40_02640 [Candidatus Bathyarchaeia archaeon]|nr:hypothetical protein [Candidatus Bathyarchaeia archaeon]
MKNKNLVDVATNKTVVVSVVIIVVLIVATASFAYIAFWQQNDESTGLEVVDIKITEPKPSIISDRSITIDYGESVTLNVTVKNKGENITSGDAYCVGIAVITSAGDEYWRLPPDQFIGVDLGPGGTSQHTFTAINIRGRPFRGECDIQAYIKSVETDEIIARSDIVTVEIMYPASSS